MNVLASIWLSDIKRSIRRFVLELCPCERLGLDERIKLFSCNGRWTEGGRGLRVSSCCAKHWIPYVAGKFL